MDESPASPMPCRLFGPSTPAPNAAQPDSLHREPRPLRPRRSMHHLRPLGRQPVSPRGGFPQRRSTANRPLARIGILSPEPDRNLGCPVACE